METNKELLEATVKGLQEKLQQLQTELNVKNLELNNINKPKLNKSEMDIIYDCINDGIHNFSFEDEECYDFEYELDYDGKVRTCNIDFNSGDYLLEDIVTQIEKKFNIIDNTEDESKSV